MLSKIASMFSNGQKTISPMRRHKPIPEVIYWELEDSGLLSDRIYDPDYVRLREKRRTLLLDTLSRAVDEKKQFFKVKLKQILDHEGFDVDDKGQLSIEGKLLVRFNFKNLALTLVGRPPKTHPFTRDFFYCIICIWY
jgi:hypothetical protein